MKINKIFVFALSIFILFVSIYTILCSKRVMEMAARTHDSAVLNQLKIGISQYNTEYNSFPPREIEALIECLEGKNPRGIKFIYLGEKKQRDNEIEKIKSIISKAPNPLSEFLEYSNTSPNKAAIPTPTR